MKIGEVAAQAGVSVDALRFYEERGLIRPHRAANGYRHYSEQTLQLVGYIKLAQQLGFRLRRSVKICRCYGTAKEPPKTS